jgi:hypothetical protein
MPKIIIVAAEPIDRHRRAIIEDTVQYLIDLLDHEDGLATDKEPDTDGEESDAGEERSWPEWSPKSLIMRP